jgi:hypothetical protein
LRASLQDSNIPLQDGGYSQRLDQFDNIFMELLSENGLSEQEISFLKITLASNPLKVQGLSANFDFGT